MLYFIVHAVTLTWHSWIKVVKFVDFRDKTLEFTVVSQIREYCKSHDG